MRRRSFLKAGPLSLAQFPYSLHAGTVKKFANDVVTLGPRQVKVSRLAMGTGTNGGGGSSNQTRKLGVGGVANLLRTAYDNGVFFFDSADQYGSHPHVREALKQLPREKVTVLTKIHSNTAQQAKADLDRIRRELGVEYLDIVLLHCMMDADWNKRKRGAMDYLEEAQGRGMVKTKGVSCHTLKALETAVAEPWVEVDLARFNPAGVAMDAGVQTVLGVLKRMKSAGKGVIGMKIIGAGRLRQRADESLQFALASGVIDCFTIGSESVEEFKSLTTKIPDASVRG
jgi:predicted aldo/keto reductase-like oxidoreductase